MENVNRIIEFSPIVLMVIFFAMQNKLFVTPEQLEKRHRDIINEVENRFVPKFSMDELKEQFSEIKLKIDKIYEVFLKQNSD